MSVLRPPVGISYDDNARHTRFATGAAIFILLVMVGVLAWISTTA